MRVNRNKKEEWDRNVQQFGFKRGYSVMAIILLFMEVHNDKLIESHQRKVKRQKDYDKKYSFRRKTKAHLYYMEHREEILEKHRAYLRENIDKERARRRRYYMANKDKWVKYHSRTVKTNQKKGSKE